MARPLRIEFPGALYHVTSRGDRREPIFADNLDRNALLDVLSIGLARMDASLLAYCLMGNHYHLVLHTRRANLSQLMRHVNGVYTQRFNRRHGLVGHLFQGRFKAIVVDSDGYLLAACRYVDLNPVRAGLVARPGDWPWSSFAAHSGQYEGPPWLDSPTLWRALLGQPVTTPDLARLGASHYADLVHSAPGLRLWDDSLHAGAVLGSDAFAARVLARAQATPPPAATLQDWLQSTDRRDQAFWNACRHGGCSMSAVAKAAGISVQRVSRLVARWEAKVASHD